MADSKGSVFRLTLFKLSLPFCAVIAVIGIVWPDQFSGTISAITGGAFATLDWFFMTSVTGFLIFCIWLAMCSYGNLKLGYPDDKPEFSTISWFSMLFAAGMGVGLLFWGVAEPMKHYIAPPIGVPESSAAARNAMVLTNFHWGLHAWGVYGVGALVLGYFHYRKGAPFLAGSPIRCVFQGKWVKPVASFADLISILAVTFGVAGSLALGVIQFHVGLHETIGIPADSKIVGVILLIIVFISYMLSAATSLDKGIQILSNINMALAFLLMVFVLLAGPTEFLLRGMVTTLGDYLSSLVGRTLQLYPYDNIGGWMGNWTLIHFLWWIAWAPPVGIFIARISRGRTIREFVMGVLIAPTLFSIVWFSIFGGMGIYEEAYGGGGIGDMVKEDVTVALFSLYERLPLTEMLTVISVILIFIFVVTSVDSATFVLGMLTSQGSMNPPTRTKLAWGIILAALGGALMLSGNLAVVRAGAISFAIPLTLILLLQLAALIRSLLYDNPIQVQDTLDQPTGESQDEAKPETAPAETEASDDKQETEEKEESDEKQEADDQPQQTGEEQS